MPAGDLGPVVHHTLIKELLEPEGQLDGRLPGVWVDLGKRSLRGN
jgi:hypothetical protein